MTWRLTGCDGGEACVVLRAAIRVNDPGSAAALTRAVAGITCLPRFACDADERAGTLLRVLPGWAPQPVPVRLVLPALRAQSAAARALVEAIYAARLDPGQPASVIRGPHPAPDIRG